MEPEVDRPCVLFEVGAEVPPRSVSSVCVRDKVNFQQSGGGSRRVQGFKDPRRSMAESGKAKESNKSYREKSNAAAPTRGGKSEI
jgi:hypothetical protein